MKKTDRLLMNPTFQDQKNLLPRIFGEGGEEEISLGHKKSRGQKPRNLAFSLIRHTFNFCAWLWWLDILLINLSAVGLPWWKIAFGGREHLVTYAAGTDSEATECQLQITDRTIQHIVYMFGNETHTHTQKKSYKWAILYQNHMIII